VIGTLEVMRIATGEEAENLETDRAKKPAGRILSRCSEFTLGILDRLLTRLRPGEHLDDLTAAVFVHFLDPPVSRRLSTLEHLGVEIFSGRAVAQDRTPLCGLAAIGQRSHL
jgi:hypothetical protein